MGDFYETEQWCLAAGGAALADVVAGLATTALFTRQLSRQLHVGARH